MPPRLPIALPFAPVLLAAAWPLLSALGCGDEGGAGISLAVGASGSGGAGGDGDSDAHVGEALFRDLEEGILLECGTCHQVGGPADTPFLGDAATGLPDPYEAITSWPEIIVNPAKNSLLLTWPDGGSHSGTKPSATLRPRLEEWLAEEAKAIKDVAGEPVPTIPPFKPFLPGFNAVYLTPLGPDYDGMAVTFQAEALTETAILLSDLQVHPTSKRGLKFEHPLFTVFPKGSPDGHPDPVDSFSNVAAEYAPGTSGPLGPGMVVLSNWSDGARLSIAFEVIQAIDPQGPAELAACAAQQEFEESAAPAFTPCLACHGGDNPTAVNAVDMSAMQGDPAEACGQILNRVNLDDPPKSQLFITTNPSGSASHPFKFNGNPGNHATFVNAVSIWIQAESS